MSDTFDRWKELYGEPRGHDDDDGDLQRVDELRTGKTGDSSGG